MEIKNFDMVECEGKIRRVMFSSDDDDEVYVAGCGWVPRTDVKLVELTVVETFEPGDKVKIKDIPLAEMRDYPHPWKKPMTKMLLHEDRVYTISEKSQICERYKINNMWFSPYHLEKVNNFDIV
jgi:hypothetical protein